MNETKATQESAPAIIFVDDEATAVKYFQRAIGSLAPVLTGGSVEEGKALLDEHGDRVGVLVSDQRMPGEFGNELLRYASERYPHVVRILTTAYSEIDQTVAAVNLGHIHRYIKKPWDITALRMELKQALELAELRKERDHLVREKLGVLQKQTIATRIGVVRSISATLIGPERFQPVETYLAAAVLANVQISEPDWLLLDYSDLVAAESDRSGIFGHKVAENLAALRNRHAGSGVSGAVSAVAGTLEEAGVKVRREGDALVWNELPALAEFLSEPVSKAVSDQHAVWLASLLWLDGNDFALESAREGDAIAFRPAQRKTEFGADRLATWIEQF
ncbi:two-component system, probable response regulator PhcQ [Paraburkholderia fungorum]|uniref:Two-component system, probable response regulator PhcQ n=1 Tax=Paraburkholderia fungorum TaxID=134537 RepID=A0A1H1JGU8_9BURK|nr:response regulator [Paraburkholderia fungorum]SDR49233.1 two-component system, probable response regulator PhcQ [Paraburkholderia fungorum]